MRVKINGMSCQHCVQSVLNATLPFAQDTPQIDLSSGFVDFVPVDGFDETEYAQVIDELGYEVAK